MESLYADVDNLKNQCLNELKRFEKRVLTQRIVPRSETHKELFIIEKFQVDFGRFYNELNNLISPISCFIKIDTISDNFKEF